MVYAYIVPNRTIYLPEDLDAASRRLGLNLSRLTQDAIEAMLAATSDEHLDEEVRLASARIAALHLDWPADVVAVGRAEAGER